MSLLKRIQVIEKQIENSTNPEQAYIVEHEALLILSFKGHNY